MPLDEPFLLVYVLNMSYHPIDTVSFVIHRSLFGIIACNFRSLSKSTGRDLISAGKSGADELNSITYSSTVYKTLHDCIQKLARQYMDIVFQLQDNIQILT